VTKRAESFDQRGMVPAFRGVQGHRLGQQNKREGEAVCGSCNVH
jgi:hypothetical protein